MRHLPIPQSPRVISTSERNWLALVSFGLGLCMLLGALIIVCGVIDFPNGIGMNVTGSRWELLVGFCQRVFMGLCLPTSLAIVATGVMALRYARSLPPDRTGQNWVLLGLLLGGLGFLVFYVILQFFPRSLPYHADPVKFLQFFPTAMP